MDYEAKHRLFHVSHASAVDMIDRATAYLVSEVPLVIALANKPRNHRAQIDVDALRPDRSLTVGASTVHAAALGIKGALKIFDGPNGWRSGRFNNGPVEEHDEKRRTA
jgi:hypothetical protein